MRHVGRRSSQRPAARWLQSSVAAAGAVLFGPSCYRGAGTRRSLALTFDDGPSPGTPRVLRLLDEYSLRATFFLCGENVERYPEIARAILRAGHELGNHTFSHRRLCPRLGWQINLLRPSAVLEEFASAQRTIAAATGVVPQLMRAPYGKRWFGMRTVRETLGLRGIMWSAIAHDWEWSSNEVAVHILRQSMPGAILCFHDGRDTRPFPEIEVTLQALQRVIPSLRDKGFQFETVSQLLRTDAEAAASSQLTWGSPARVETADGWSGRWRA